MPSGAKAPAAARSGSYSSSSAPGPLAELARELKHSDAMQKERVAIKLTAAIPAAPASALPPTIGPLVAMLRSEFTTEGGQQAAAAALAAVAAHDEQARREVAQAGAVLPLVTLLTSGSNKAAAVAASALALLAEADVGEPRAVIIRGGGLPGLVRLLRVGTADAQANAAMCIASVVRGDPDAQAAVGGDATGAVALLIAMLHSGKAQMAAAAALATLASHAAPIQRSIMAEGGVAPLLALLNGANIGAQVHGASALAELARDNADAQVSIARAGGIGPLLAMLTARNADAQAHAAHAIAQLANGHHDNQEAIARAGGLPPLVQLLGPGQAHDVHANAALAVAAVARANTDIQTQIFDLGAIPSIVALFRGGHTGVLPPEQVKAQAAGTLFSLAEGHATNKAAIAGAGGLPPLVDLLATGGPRAMEKASLALAALSLDAVEILSQLAALLISVLARPIADAEADAKRRAARLLWVLIEQNRQLSIALATAGDATEVVRLLKLGTDEAQAYALWSLSLSIDESTQKILLDEESVPPLVEALQAVAPKSAAAIPGTTTREQAASALALLAADHKKAQQAIAAAHGIPPLIAVLQPTRDDTMVAREHAAAALAHLALQIPNCHTIVDEGGVEPLVLLLNEGGPTGKQNAAAGLAHLSAGHAESALAFAQAGAIPLLVELLSGDHGDGAQEEGCHALLALAQHSENRIAITDAGGTHTLVGLLAAPNLRARTHAEGALVRLSIEASNRVIIINRLVSLLRDTNDEHGDAPAPSAHPHARVRRPSTAGEASTDGAGGEEVKSAAATALANLARDSVDNRSTIVSAGGIEPLLSLLRGSNPQAKENAIDAVTQLAFKSVSIQAK